VQWTKWEFKDDKKHAPLLRHGIGMVCDVPNKWSLARRSELKRAVELDGEKKKLDTILRGISISEVVNMQTHGVSTFCDDRTCKRCGFQRCPRCNGIHWGSMYNFNGWTEAVRVRSTGQVVYPYYIHQWPLKFIARLWPSMSIPDYITSLSPSDIRFYPCDWMPCKQPRILSELLPETLVSSNICLMLDYKDAMKLRQLSRRLRKVSINWHQLGQRDIRNKIQWSMNCLLDACSIEPAVDPFGVITELDYCVVINRAKALIAEAERKKVEFQILYRVKWGIF
jgi:hypothetical protein